MIVDRPWHSVHSPVYHNNNECHIGNNIEIENLRYGHAYKELCKECERLNNQGK